MPRSRTLFAPPIALPIALTLLAPALACSDVGTHVIEVRGAESVVTGLDAAEFADGWSVSFEQFIVVIQDPALIEDVDGKPAWVRQLGGTAFDVASEGAEGGAHELMAAKIRASEYDAFDFYVAPPNDDYPTEASADLDDAIVDEMIDNGWSIRVIGSATDGVQTINFDWGFATSTLYRCRADLEIPAEDEGVSTIEILGDVLFHNELQDPDPAHAFAAIAGADANMDGTVTLDELAAAPLPMGYDPKDVEVATLGEFVTELSRSIGGLAGGSCEVVSD